MVWYMVSIPREYIDAALEVAKIAGVIIGPPPGKILTFQGSTIGGEDECINIAIPGSIDFPVKGPIVYGLQYLASHYPGLDIHKDMERIIERDHEGCEQIVTEATGINNAYR